MNFYITLGLILLLDLKRCSTDFIDEEIVFPILTDKYGTNKTSNIFDFQKYLAKNETIYVKISLNGQQLIMNLSLNRKFLNQKSLIQRKYKNFDRISYIRDLKKFCYFIGKLNNDLRSYVSVSLCNGISGFIHLNNSVYIIEPVEVNLNFSYPAMMPHRVYKSDSSFSIDFFDQNIDAKRLKKSLSIKRTVEALVVADKTMSDRYQNIDLENYLLTVMNMVSAVFKDPSLESNINIVVVKVIIIDEEDPFEVVTNASATLNNFCRYQDKINLPEPHPNHHDLAILVTRVDICANSNTPCDTSGYTSLGSMCDPPKSCNVNEDTGLSLAFTIAHEIGHNFNADHDTLENGCTNSTSPFLMNSHLTTTLKKNHFWSECSKKQINKFLEQTDLKCLEDKNNLNLVYKDELFLPGIFYDINHQCKFSYGDNATVCSNHHNQCDEVWCQVGNNDLCVSKGEKVADGTLCGDGQKTWCIEGECVMINELKAPVDGGWGDWSEWSNCSRLCNGGIQFIERKCNNPVPKNNGNFCLGEQKRYRICNTGLCNDSNANLNFKNEQCSKFNEVPQGINNITYEWEYYSFETNPCKLYCRPKTEHFYKNFNENLIDGTSCSLFSNDVCINGICKPVGCDWVLGSNTTFDSCGVCGGDNTTCNLYKGSLDVVSPAKGGYQPLFVIPKGALSIRIIEYSKQKNNNYLAIKNENGTYYLNGNFFISSSGDYIFNSQHIRYVMDDKGEYIKSSGPLTENLFIMLLLLEKKATVTYQYTLPSSHEIEEQKKFYSWEYDTDWSACSKSCGKGFKKIVAFCKEFKGEIVQESFCSHLTKPNDIVEHCNLIECEPDWWIGEWQDCSATCETSGIGVRKRSVFCVILKPNTVNDETEIISVLDKECEPKLRPHSVEECTINLDKCNDNGETRSRAYWITEDWNRNCVVDLCSIETRKVKCSDINAICDPNIRPSSERKCELPDGIKCGSWKASSWSSCVPTCGNATRNRTIECVDGNLCSKLNEPHSIEICLNNPPCTTTTTTTTTELTTTIPSVSINNIEMPEFEDDIYADLIISLKNSTNNENNSNETELLDEDFPTDNHTTVKIKSKTNTSKTTNKISKISITTKKAKSKVKKERSKKISLREIFVVNVLSFGNETLQDNNDNISIIENNKEFLKLNESNSLKETEIFNDTKLISNSTDNLNNTINYNQTEIDENSIFGEFTDDYETFNEQSEYNWQEGVFGQCSKPCGYGYKSRKVECVSNKTHEIVDEKNCKKLKPNTLEKCKIKECHGWNVTEWSECLSVCGSGFQTRKIFCMDINNLCDNETVPVTKKPCLSKPCYEWISEEWSPCSASCGIGFKIRRVYCYSHLTNSTAEYCDKNVIPKTLKKCSVLKVCPIETSNVDKCIDKFGKSLCKIVAYSNRCNEPYLYSKCCKTCSKHLS